MTSNTFLQVITEASNVIYAYRTQQGSFRPFTIYAGLYFSDRLLSNTVFTCL